jgi:hypothetical protein
MGSSGSFTTALGTALAERLRSAGHTLTTERITQLPAAHRSGHFAHLTVTPANAAARDPQPPLNLRAQPLR